MNIKKITLLAISLFAFSALMQGMDEKKDNWWDSTTNWSSLDNRYNKKSEIVFLKKKLEISSDVLEYLESLNTKQYKEELLRQNEVLEDLGLNFDFFALNELLIIKDGHKEAIIQNMAAFLNKHFLNSDGDVICNLLFVGRGDNKNQCLLASKIGGEIFDAWLKLSPDILTTKIEVKKFLNTETEYNTLAWHIVKAHTVDQTFGVDTVFQNISKETLKKCESIVESEKPAVSKFNSLNQTVIVYTNKNIKTGYKMVVDGCSLFIGNVVLGLMADYFKWSKVWTTVALLPLFYGSWKMSSCDNQKNAISGKNVKIDAQKIIRNMMIPAGFAFGYHVIPYMMRHKK